MRCLKEKPAAPLSTARPVEGDYLVGRAETKKVISAEEMRKRTQQEQHGGSG